MPNSAIVELIQILRCFLKKFIGNQKIFVGPAAPSVPTSFTSVPGVQALDYINKRQNAEAAVGKKHLDSSLLLVQHLEGCLLLLDLPAHDHDDHGSCNESNIDNGDDGVDGDDNQDLPNAFIFWNGVSANDIVDLQKFTKS